EYHAYIPRGDRDYAVTVGIRMLVLRRVLLEDDGIYTVNQSDILLLQYYANSIEHLVARVTHSATASENQNARALPDTAD
ncbi:MAG: hypothetical protein AAF404_19650, partial [Pseudomonadota bacterium]